MTSYDDSGVDVALGDEASRILYEAAKQTWENRKGLLGEVVEVFPDFTGLRAVHVGGLPSDTFMSLGFDGVGTKVEVAERTGRHETVAFDLFAMVCDDAVVRGAEPVVLGSVLDVRSLGSGEENYLAAVRQLADSSVAAAREVNVAVINGEVAELGARVHGHGPFNYNWGAGLVWFARKSRLLTGYDVRAGDAVVGLREEGFRSNGLSLVRRILSEKHGPDWDAETFDQSTLGDAVLQPSRIYTGAVMEMRGGFDGTPRATVHAVAHVTGGGLPGKLGRALKPSGLGAILDDPFSPPELMRHCQAIGDVSDREAYQTWCMGQGMALVTPDPDAVMAVARERDIGAHVIGHVTRRPGITIRNRGYWRETELLQF